MLEKTPDQPSKFRIKYWVEINDDACRKYQNDSQIKIWISISMKSSLCDFSDVNKRVIGTITIAGEGADDNAKWLDKRNKGVLKIVHHSLTV